MEEWNFNTIINLEGSFAHLPGKIKLQENIPVATYMVTPVTRIEILNQKETVQSMITGGEISLLLLLEHVIVNSHIIGSWN